MERTGMSTKKKCESREDRIFRWKRIRRSGRIGFAVVTFLLAIVLLLTAGAIHFSNMAGAIDNVVFAKAPTGQKAMRQAAKNILYMIGNSDAPMLYESQDSTIGKVLIAVFIVLMLLFAQYYIFVRLKKWKSGETVEKA